ncbi:hypothetical protein PC110_g12871 [Phytophthora cactorum]|uniref:Reverse transcriptase domain-containing protein n=1 Tax=Phytophthora cactorum TaxID=29920 RepID=A0A329S2M8_9STRA|nr:hypothetical protein PC110_g12871 [Phytophthora cactorum]
MFTRILGWRVNKHVAKLVHNTLFGFTPRLTIRKTIDLLEAAKAVCQQSDNLKDAQVLLLDFAKAYDSLDRTFLLKVLEAKGFPPRFCAVVKDIHEHTTTQFMANGQVSREFEVTSGVSIAPPPPAIIIAVDLLYDEIHKDHALKGIPLHTATHNILLKIAGYADDTAIYIAHKKMQEAVLAAVERFSRFAGLRLNVHKSVAIRLGREIAESGEENSTCGSSEQETIPTSEESRYLGHLAGEGDTVTNAWERAFKALSVRLALAIRKTNTVQQRAQLAAAIIIPKLLYVGRHACPTLAIVVEAGRRIKNFIWKSKFTIAEQVGFQQKQQKRQYRKGAWPYRTSQRN